MELTDITLSILKSNAICLTISYGIYFIRNHYIEDQNVVLSKQNNVILIATFINGFLTSIFTKGWLTVSIISGLSYAILDNTLSIVFSNIIDQSKIADIIKHYKYNLYGTKENMLLSLLYLGVTILLSIIGWLLFLVMSYFHR